MSRTDKFLQESMNYPAEDSKFMKMAINLSIENIDSDGGPFRAVEEKEDKVRY